MPNREQLPPPPSQKAIWMQGAWYDQMRKWWQNMRFTDGLGRIVLNRDSVNITLDTTGIVSRGGGGGSGSGMTPVRIDVATTTSDTVIGSLYSNGITTDATTTGVTIRILQIAAGETMPTGTYLPAWQEAWATGTQWTVDVARDYGAAT